MPQYLDRIEPEDVRFLMDFSEFKELVIDMLGDAKKLVQVKIDFEKITDEFGATIIRPMVKLEETSYFTEERRHEIIASGFSIDREPFDNGDYAMEQIFGQQYTVIDATHDADGSFFSIEMPYHYFIELKQS